MCKRQGNENSYCVMRYLKLHHEFVYYVSHKNRNHIFSSWFFLKQCILCEVETELLIIRKWNVRIIKKPTRYTISQLYFGKELYMFRTDLLSIIRSLDTVFTATGICHTSYVDCLLAVLTLRFQFENFWRRKTFPYFHILPTAQI